MTMGGSRGRRRRGDRVTGRRGDHAVIAVFVSIT
jgi:hypothetical protein